LHRYNQAVLKKTVCGIFNQSSLGELSDQWQWYMTVLVSSYHWISKLNLVLHANEQYHMHVCLSIPSEQLDSPECIFFFGTYIQVNWTCRYHHLVEKHKFWFIMNLIDNVETFCTITRQNCKEPLYWIKIDKWNIEIFSYKVVLQRHLKHDM